MPRESHGELHVARHLWGENWPLELLGSRIHGRRAIQRNQERHSIAVDEPNPRQNREDWIFPQMLRKVLRKEPIQGKCHDVVCLFFLLMSFIECNSMWFLWFWSNQIVSVFFCTKLHFTEKIFPDFPRKLLFLNDPHGVPFCGLPECLVFDDRKLFKISQPNLCLSKAIFIT